MPQPPSTWSSTSSNQASQTAITDARPPRLQQVLARRGIASRRDAEDLIVAGRVSVDGVIVSELGTRADPDVQRIAVDGRPIGGLAPARYIGLHKPTGYVSTAEDPGGRPTVMRLVPAIAGLFPVGRLDTASEGLLLFTNDGDWAQHVTHPRYGCAKEYEVEVVGRITDQALVRLRGPLDLGLGDWSSGAQVEVLGAMRSVSRVRITLHEGRNRQVRRMCAAVGFEVVALVRTRVGPVSLAGIVPGHWRELRPAEVTSIARQSVAPRRRAPQARPRRDFGPAAGYTR